MTTIAVGQHVVQRYSERVWRLDTPFDDDRWHITLVESRPGDARRPGYRSTASLEWLQEACDDFIPPTIDPPCGDGVQTVEIFDGNGLCLEGSTFTTAAEMIAWTEAAFVDLAHAEHDLFDLTGKWWGFIPNDGDAPDMTVRPNEGWMVGDDELTLVWAEA